MDKLYDSLHMGRSSIDLYANDVGAPFVDIQSFAAYVGGSPSEAFLPWRVNIIAAASRRIVSLCIWGR